MKVKGSMMSYIMSTADESMLNSKLKSVRLQRLSDDSNDVLSHLKE
jgi:hypothetical protein